MKKEERTWAMFCHLGGFAGYIVPFGNILAPLIIWMVKKEELPSIVKHGKEAVNFQLSITLYTIIAALLVLIAIGIPLLFILLIIDIIFIIKAAIAASNGEHYHYPLTIRFIK